jgi:carbon-monoxide dehydrogenase large subunit
LIERMVDVLAQRLNIDKAEIRRRNFIRKEQFPYTSAFGFEYDSGGYHTAALQKALDARRLSCLACRAGRQAQTQTPPP